MTSNEHRELARIAADAAKAGGKICRDAFARPPEQIAKKGAVDLVTETDLAVEAYLRERLIAETGFALLGEEGGKSEGTGGELVWIVDPIDGTTNFAHRVPHFAVSIGLWRCDGSGQPTEAVLGAMRSPIVDELFWCDGDRAWLNDAVLPPLDPTPLDVALLASGFPYDRRTNDDDNTALWRAFLKRCQGCRRFGAAALDLAWVAAGRLDGFWEARLKPWDVAAGVALVQCVGGVTFDYAGAPYQLDASGIVAAHPDLARTMVEVIAATRGDG